MVIALGAGYAETCKSGSGDGSAETADESQYGAAVPTSHFRAISPKMIDKQGVTRYNAACYP